MEELVTCLSTVSNKFTKYKGRIFLTARRLMLGYYIYAYWRENFYGDVEGATLTNLFSYLDISISGTRNREFDGPFLKNTKK